MSTTRHDDEDRTATAWTAEDLFRSPQAAADDDGGDRPRDGGPEAMRRLQFPFEVEPGTGVG
jgi:hypothetical protein